MPKNNPVTTLRVISGSFKGRKLSSPRSATTHPMGAREKNALFNMLDVREKRILDAYAGSGALGIEALSRGAREVVFVENDRRAIATIREDLASLSLANQTTVFAGKVADFAENHTQDFDIIIADPPYDKIDSAEIAKLVPLLAVGGAFALSSPASQPALEIPGLTAASSHTYAEARITIYHQGKE